MKKTITIITLVALFVSCAKEAEQTPATSGDVITVAPTEFSATLETPEPDTKTNLGGTNGKQILWEEGDSISVWPGVFAQAKYTLSSGAGTNSATFTLSSEPATGEQQGMFTFALYPYDADVELGFNQTGHGLSLSNVKHPAVQNYRENSWDKGAMPMCGELNDESNSLQLMNLAGVLRLTLTGTATIDSIRVSALDNYERISGTAQVTIAYPGHGVAENTVLVAFDSESSSNTVTLKCSESGVTLSEATGTVFNIVIPPIAGGFEVTIYDNAHGFMVLKSSSEIKRNKILNMPEKTYAPTAMDLGLSVYWATCNVGATTPEGYGDYFAWGETEPYYTAGHAYDDTCTNWKDGKSSGYAWASYSLTSNGGSTFTDFTDYGTDGKTTLESDDDAANKNCGSAWRMPTESEMTALKDDCEWTWTTQNGVNGYKVVSKKEGYEGASIFLPAAGIRYEDSFYDAGGYGGYWASSLNLADPSCARSLGFEDSDARMYSSDRCCGLSVRPVSVK